MKPNLPPQPSCPVPEAFRSLTWEELEKWTDSGSIKRGKGYVGNVSDEGITEDGRIVATVSGTDDYATELRFDDSGSMEGRCTCPVGHRCKHTVALILKCIDLLSAGKPLPLLDEDDDRLEDLREEAEWDDDFEDEYGEEEEDGDKDDDAAGGSGDRSSPVRLSPSRPATRDELDDHIDSLNEAAAKALLRDIIAAHPDIRADLLRNVRTDRGDVSQLLKMARRELKRLARQDAYVNPWKHEFHVPDYTPLRDILRKLLAKRAFDELVAFGDELKSETISQIECAHDEGETGNQICSCMEVVGEAVRQSSLSSTEQLRWFFNIRQNDEYCTFDDLYDPFDHPGDWTKADWSAFADDLRSAFSAKDLEKGESGYWLNRSLNRVCSALSHAGRENEARTIRIDCFTKSRSYVDLAKLYRDEGDLGAAWDAAVEGLTRKNVPDPYGRNKEELRGLLREFATKRGDLRLALSLQAEDFFTSPSEEGFFALLAAAKAESLDTAIRPWLIRFLETKLRPDDAPLPTDPPSPPKKKTGKSGRPPKGGKKAAKALGPSCDSHVPEIPWPLAPSGMPLLSAPRYVESGATILLRIALEEKNPDEILKRWKETCAKGRLDSLSSWNPYDRFDDQVADALADAHPDVALGIWDETVRRNLPSTSQDAYGVIADAFRKERPVMERLGRLDEWANRIRSLQTEYKRRKNFVQALSAIVDPPAPPRPILETRRT